MALWDMIKKGAEEGLEALKEGVSVFVLEAERKGKILKRKVELSTLQASVRKTFVRLGAVVYEIHGRGETDVFSQPEVKSLFAQIEGFKLRVKEIEQEIEGMRRDQEKDRSSKGAAPEKEPPPSPPPA
ncbi:MAG: hypothetical protein HY697_02475 [Deltaproteobacteria bacterium]|nr:hypothetical protein [Deltaproteobacteria bacterium]